MIQRIQSVYLLLTTILAGLFLTGIFFNYSVNEGTRFIMKISGIYESSRNAMHRVSTDDIVLIQRIIPVLLIAAIIPLVSLITVFLFRNRKLQMKAILLLIILDILLIATSGYYILGIIRPESGDMIPAFRMFIPVINLILGVMAYFAVRKDEKMVRSYDRLR